MVHHHGSEAPGPEISYMERTHKRTQIVYAQQTRERQFFMQELQELRKQRTRQVMRNMKELVGPTWYQVLSVPQRQALDTLEFAIYQDVLEGRPVKTTIIMRKLGICPLPGFEDLMNCNQAGKDDPKAMLAHLFLINFGHTIDGKLLSYCLNAKLILTSILYLGLKNLIELLRERFKPDPKPTKEKPQRKPKPKVPLASPYLQKMVAKFYEPPQRKKFQPDPLPNLDDLDEPYEEEPPIPKPPPPPPPPPPPKKKYSRAFCDKMAGIMPIEAYSEVPALTTPSKMNQRQKRGTKAVTEGKKSYGISLTRPKKGSRRRKLKAPSTGIPNTQHMIQGVFTIHGKTVYVLGNVSILPPSGDLIHGGFRILDGHFVNIHCGFRGFPPPPKPDPCACVKKWQDTVFKYVKNQKCHCGHNYDFGHEGTFPPENLQYFQKPTVDAPFQFNYHTIFDVDEKGLLIEKEFKKVWDTDSVIGPKNALQKDTKKKKKRSSKTCLGPDPKPEDYLKCALRFMRRVNLAARLPDVHLAPELLEWMRRRIYGPYSQQERREYVRSSNDFYQQLVTLAVHGYGHIATRRVPAFMGVTNWTHKLELNRRFRNFAMDYRMQLFRSFARINNLMWPTLYHVKFPDKKFREIFFSYMCGTVDDLQIMHPYSTAETAERARKMQKRRYICLPAGIEPDD